MGEAEEEIIIPTETQGLTALRRRGLVVLLAATALMLGIAALVVVI